MSLLQRDYQSALKDEAEAIRLDPKLARALLPSVVPPLEILATRPMRSATLRLQWNSILRWTITSLSKEPRRVDCAPSMMLRSRPGSRAVSLSSIRWIGRPLIPSVHYIPKLLPDDIVISMPCVTDLLTDLAG